MYTEATVVSMLYTQFKAATWVVWLQVKTPSIATHLVCLSPWFWLGAAGVQW